MAINIVETFSVSPSDGAAADQSLPLLYFDIVWLDFPPTQTLYFYSFKCSESRFLDTTVAQLKHSLSVTLNRFLPLAAKIVFPLTSASMPVFRYNSGDSVSLTIAVSGADFADMTGNHFRSADEFHQLVPQMPLADYSDDAIRFSSIAVQVTLFPNQGICIGFTHHHAVCDLTSLIGFICAWSSVNKLHTDEHSDGNLLLDIETIPSYNRSRVQDANKLTMISWEQVKSSRPIVSLTNHLPINKIRATFMLYDAQINRLKSFAMMKKPAIGRLSSFVVVSAHIWSCLAKLEEEVADDEPEYLTSSVDCRARLEPPLPGNFFGNCLVLLQAHTTHGRLRGDKGFEEAIKAIAVSVKNTVKHGRGISEYFENEKKIISELVGKRVVWLAGSTRVDHYGADFGWGRPIKYECIHTDFDEAVCLCKGKDGGIEIGMSMPRAKMEAFATIFNQELCINSKL